MTVNVLQRVDDRWRLDTGELRFERRSQDGGSNGTTWGDITGRAEENANLRR